MRTETVGAISKVELDSQSESHVAVRDTITGKSVILTPDATDTAAVFSDPWFILSNFFALDSRSNQDTATIEDGDTVTKISPSRLGRAHQRDKELIIMAQQSLLEHKAKHGWMPRAIDINIREFYRQTRPELKKLSGKHYTLFQEMLVRLQGTQIETTQDINGMRHFGVFSFLDVGAAIAEVKSDGSVYARRARIQLSDPLFNNIAGVGTVVKYADNYYSLPPLTQRISEIIHSDGHQHAFRIELAELYKRSATTMTHAMFKFRLGEMEQDNKLSEGLSLSLYHEDTPEEPIPFSKRTTGFEKLWVVVVKPSYFDGGRDGKAPSLHSIPLFQPVNSRPHSLEVEMPKE